MKETFLSLPSSSIWYDVHLKLSLPASPSLSFVDSPGTNSHCPFVFSIDLGWPILYLMTGWLSIRKHFITACYSKQVKQCCEDSACLAHMSIRDLIMLKSKRPVPCVSARFECSALYVWANYVRYMHKHTTEFNQCLANVLWSWRTCTILALIFICILKCNECLCFKDGIKSCLI